MAENKSAAASQSQQPPSKAAQVVEFAKAYVDRGNPYAWGGKNKDLTDANVAALQDQYKNDPNANYSHLQKGGKDYDKVNKSGYKCIDCSGLTEASFAHVGVNIGTGSYSQHDNNVSKEIPLAAAQPGDLLWKQGHVAVMGYNGKRIEAASPKSGCIYSNTTAGMTKAFRILSDAGTYNPADSQSTTGGATDQVSGGTYTVVSGDTLYGIALRFGVAGGYKALMEYNSLTSEIINVGQVLRIPGTGTTTTTPEPAPAPQPTTQSSGQEYSVVRGDSLYGIATRFGVAGGYQALMKYNNLTDATIYVGQIIRIPGTGSSNPVPTPSTPAPSPQSQTSGTPAGSSNQVDTSYTVVAGDSLYGIATRYLVAGGYQTLMKYNNLTDATIYVGQVIKIPGGSNPLTQQVQSGNLQLTGKLAEAYNDYSKYLANGLSGVKNDTSMDIYSQEEKAVIALLPSKIDQIQSIAKLADRPPEVVAAIWYKEMSFKDGCYLHNGDPLGQETVHVPYGKFFRTDQFVEAAVDAINSVRANTAGGVGLTYSSKDYAAMCTFCEAYNGFGYRNKGTASAYVSSGTDKYTGGLYVADGQFDYSKKSKSLGVIRIFKFMADMYPR